MSAVNGTTARLWEALEGRVATARELADDLNRHAAEHQGAGMQSVTANRAAMLLKQLAERGVIRRCGTRGVSHARAATLFERVPGAVFGRPKGELPGAAHRERAAEISLARAARAGADALLPPVTRVESIAEFTARGGRIERLPSGWTDPSSERSAA